MGQAQANAPPARPRKKKDSCSFCGMLAPTASPVRCESAAPEPAVDESEVQALLGKQAERRRRRPSASSTADRDSATEGPRGSGMFSSQLRASLQNRTSAEERWLQAKSEWEKCVVAQIEAEARRAAEHEAAVCRDMDTSREESTLVPAADGTSARAGEGEDRHGTAAAGGDRDEARRAALRMIALEQSQDEPKQAAQEPLQDEPQEPALEQTHAEPQQAPLEQSPGELQPEDCLSSALCVDPGEGEIEQPCSSKPILLPKE